MTTLLLILAAVIVAVLIAAALQPNEFRVTRSTVVEAPPAAVFELVNDTRRAGEWSPWMKMEPTARYTHSGPPAGVGAAIEWEGKKTGAGTNTIIESVPDTLVRSRLDFRKPFKATNTAEFTLRSEAGRTIVIWTMQGPNKFLGKLFGLIMNCDKMIGGQFELGLADIKRIAENKNKAAA